MECEHAFAPSAEIKSRQPSPVAAPGFEQPFAGLQRGAGNLAVQRRARISVSDAPRGRGALPMLHDVLRSPGQPLDRSIRDLMEPRLSADFSPVRIHTDSRAAASAHSVDALAYTVGSHIVFAAGQYAPDTTAGRRLLAHELTHVVQQSRSSFAPHRDGHATTMISQPSAAEHPAALTVNTADDKYEREADYISARILESPETKQKITPSSTRSPAILQRQAGGGSGGAGSPACSIPAGCPPDFCTPFSSRLLAIAARDAAAPVLLAGIGAKVSPRVVPLWTQYLFGGAAPQNLSGAFGRDFTNSATTSDTTDFLADELKNSLETSPPSLPAGSRTVTVSLSARIASAIAEIGNPTSAHAMDFDVIGEIPGNIAGGIGKDQLTCSVGARPSPFNDDRTAAGTAEVTQNTDGSLGVIPSIQYRVQDTIDLCPGNCGADIEQRATVPLSRFEATGISGDVPFVVEFPAPPRSFTAQPPIPAPPAPVPVPAGPITGETIASQLRIRQSPSTSSPILGFYPRNSLIQILCETTGTDVEGNPTWDQTDRGFVSDRFVNRLGGGTPPEC